MLILFFKSRTLCTPCVNKEQPVHTRKALQEHMSEWDLPRVTGMGKKRPVPNHKTTAYTPTCFLIYSRKPVFVLKEIQKGGGEDWMDVEGNGRKRFHSSVITTLTFILLILCMTVMFKTHKIREKHRTGKILRTESESPSVQKQKSITL